MQTMSKFVTLTSPLLSQSVFELLRLSAQLPAGVCTEKEREREHIKALKDVHQFSLHHTGMFSSCLSLPSLPPLTSCSDVLPRK